MNEREAEEHHRGDEQRVADEERDDEDPNGVLSDRRDSRTARPVPRVGLEHGRPGCSCSHGRVEPSGRVWTAGPACGLDVHVAAFTRRTHG